MRLSPLHPLLALACAALAQAAFAAPPLVLQEFQCRGEEPFWGLAGTRVSAVLSTPGVKGKRETVFRGALQNVGAGAPTTLVWRGESTHLPKDTLVVVLREEACRSTMADGPTLTHRAVLSLRGSDALTGCCSLTLGPPPPAKAAP
ncbi:MAG: hypothetical protein U1F10_07340 [Burkholderiales bacterium]